MGAQLTPDTMIPLMLQSQQIWMFIESFVTLVMKARELDGRAERGGKTRASRNRIGACTRGPAFQADLAVHVIRMKNLFIPPVVGAASRFA